MTPAELTRLREIAERAKPQEEWAQKRSGFTTGGFDKERLIEATLWYDDGDLCCDIHGNLAIGIDASSIAEHFAAFNPETALQLLDEIENVTKERDEALALPIPGEKE